jgi:hypothetical protein
MHSAIMHYQIVHMKGTCPDENSDFNADGVIDAVEGMELYGGRLLPLDSNLNTQEEGIGYGPVANEEGSYHYKRSAPLARLFGDLKVVDVNLEDSLVKLSQSDKLELDKRVLVVYGISSAVELPGSVAAFEGKTSQESLPVACGQIERAVLEI